MAPSYLPYLFLIPLLAAAAVASHHGTPSSARARLLHHEQFPSTAAATTRFDAASSKRRNHHEPEASQKQLIPYSYLPEACPPLPPHAGSLELAAWGGDEGLAMVLRSLGYNEMGSAAALLADSPSIKRWPGSITIFAAPDSFLRAWQASGSGSSPRHLLLEHMSLGYFPYSDLAATPTVRIPSASVGFCLNITAVRSPFTVDDVSLHVDGVEISHPDLYNDGRYVVHGIYGVIPPLTPASCFEGLAQHRHDLSAITAATSSAAAASFSRVMIIEATSRLHDGGYGFVALAMRVNLRQLEKLANLTVFALDDHSIFAPGGHDFVSSARFHIVPGHRLTRADLVRLRAGTVLPTIAGEDQKLVITAGAGSVPDEIRINYMPLKHVDVVVTSHVVVHGIHASFPRLHLADLAASGVQMHDICGDSDCASKALYPSIIQPAQDHGEELAAASVVLPVVSGNAELEDSGKELGKQQLAESTCIGRGIEGAHDSRSTATKASKGRHGGLCQCLLSRFHSTGSTSWRIAKFILKYSLKISWFLVFITVSFMSVLATNLAIHVDILCGIGISLASAIIYMMLPDAPTIGFLDDIPVDQIELDNFKCACGKEAMFRLSYVARWFCRGCLENHVVSNHCAPDETNPTPSRKRFRILVFGEPYKVQELSEYPELHHTREFPSWYISRVYKNWYKGEVEIEYTSLNDLLKLRKPRKSVIIYDTRPPHKVLKDASGQEETTTYNHKTLM